MRTPRASRRFSPNEAFPGFVEGQRWRATYNPENPERGPLAVFGETFELGESKEVNWLQARTLSMCPGMALYLLEEEE